MIRVRDRQDFLAGALLFLAGGVVARASLAYPIGSARQMGPGYMPFYLSCALMILAAAIMGKSLAAEDRSIEPFAWRQLLFIMGGPLAFALLVGPAGMLLSLMAVVWIGSFASDESRWPETLALSVALSALSIVGFIYLLGQPIPVLGHWFR